MSTAWPTILVGLDRFGRDVVERFQQSIEDRDPQLAAITSAPTGLEQPLRDQLEALLRAGRSTRADAQPHVDLLLFQDLSQDSADDLVSLCDTVSRVLGQGFRAMFPSDAPPEQRTATLHVVLLIPPLGSDPRTAACLEQLRGVERWAESPTGYPVLSRVWMLGWHTRSGVLSYEELVASASAFSLATLSAGLRQAEAVRARLDHDPHALGRFGFLSVASLDLPESRLQRYATIRAAHDGLRTLVNRVARQVGDATEAEAAVAVMEADRWIEPFIAGDVASSAQLTASHLSGGSAGLPEAVGVGPFDSQAAIRGRYGILYEPGVRPREVTARDQSQLDEIFHRMDRAESDAAASVSIALQKLYDGALGRSTGLRQLPEVELGLRQLQARLEDQIKADAPVDDHNPPSDDDPFRDELEQATVGLPPRGALIATAAFAGLGLGLLALCITLVISAPPVAQAVESGAAVAATGVETGFNWDRWGHWIAGGLTALVGSVAFAVISGMRSRQAIQGLLTERRDALLELRNRGGGGKPGLHAAAQLRLRRTRTRLGIMSGVRHALDRLTALREGLIEARDEARRQLVELGVSPAEEASLDDLSQVLGDDQLLHASLVSPPALVKWVARGRRVADPEVWATRMLEHSWPDDGLGSDIPCGDMAQLLELAREQVSPLREESIFDDAGTAAIAAQRVREFVARAPAALAPATIPRDVHGDPVRGVRPGETLVVAPVGGRDALVEALQHAPFNLHIEWTADRAARVVFVRGWEGFTVDDVERGAS